MEEVGRLGAVLLLASQRVIARMDTRLMSRTPVSGLRRHRRTLKASFTSRNRMESPQFPSLGSLLDVYPDWLSNRKDFQDLRNQYEHLDTIDIYSACLRPALSRSDCERKAIMRFMKSCPYFSNMKDDQLADISDRMKSVQFQQGETLMKRGEKADCLYMIVKGKVGIYLDSDVAKDEVCEHNVIGESAVQTKNTRTATVKAHCVVETLKLTYEDYDHIVFRLKLQDFYQVASFLQTIDYFSSWNISKLYRLASVIIAKQYRRGQRVYSIGEEMHDLYIVKEGQVSLTVQLNLERSNRWPTKVNEWAEVQTTHRYEKSLKVCTSGMFFGEHDLIARIPHSTNAICTSDSCLLYVVIEDFFREIFSDKDCKLLVEINAQRPNSGYLRGLLEQEKRMIRLNSEAMLDAFNMNHIPHGRNVFLAHGDVKKAEWAKLIVSKKKGGMRKDLVKQSKEEIRTQQSFRSARSDLSKRLLLSPR